MNVKDLIQVVGFGDWIHRISLFSLILEYQYIMIAPVAISVYLLILVKSAICLALSSKCSSLFGFL